MTVDGGRCARTIGRTTAGRLGGLTAGRPAVASSVRNQHGCTAAACFDWFTAQ
jgi:hypothetical protein